jgi:hypothetical protein
LLITENGDYTFCYHSKKITLLKVIDLEKPLDLNHDWELEFPSLQGAPSTIRMPVLRSLHLHQDPGVRYFSGTALYRKHFLLPAKNIPENRKIILHMGMVEVLAQVTINKKDYGTLWKRPFNIDITEAIKPGQNILEIRVTNLWPNRLIGDEQLPEENEFTMATGSGFEELAGQEDIYGYPIQQLPQWYMKGLPKPEKGRICFTTWKHFSKNDPLMESGLIGPVTLQFSVMHQL